jgi:hypothetical protein
MNSATFASPTKARKALSETWTVTTGSSVFGLGTAKSKNYVSMLSHFVSFSIPHPVPDKFHLVPACYHPKGKHREHG